MFRMRVFDCEAEPYKGRTKREDDSQDDVKVPKREPYRGTVCARRKPPDIIFSEEVNSNRQQCEKCPDHLKERVRSTKPEGN